MGGKGVGFTVAPQRPLEQRPGSLPWKSAGPSLALQLDPQQIGCERGSADGGPWGCKVSQFPPKVIRPAHLPPPQLYFSEFLGVCRPAGSCWRGKSGGWTEPTLAGFPLACENPVNLTPADLGNQTSDFFPAPTLDFQNKDASFPMFFLVKGGKFLWVSIFRLPPAKSIWLCKDLGHRKIIWG